MRSSRRSGQINCGTAKAGAESVAAAGSPAPEEAAAAGGAAGLRRATTSRNPSWARWCKLLDVKAQPSEEIFPALSCLLGKPKAVPNHRGWLPPPPLPPPPPAAPKHALRQEDVGLLPLLGAAREERYHYTPR